MQKNWKRSEASNAYETRSRRGAPAFPEILDLDALGIMLDDDLLGRLRTLEDDRNTSENMNMDTRPWEEEIAYLRREQQIRRIRRDTHADYVRRSEDEFSRLEASLPAGDFDNSIYVYAATGGRPPRGS